jgi:integrase
MRRGAEAHDLWAKDDKTVIPILRFVIERDLNRHSLWAGIKCDRRFIDYSGWLQKCPSPKSKDKNAPPPRVPFPAIHFHNLRRSAATILLAQGVSPRYIAELLGHWQVSFTMQTYAHVLPEVQKQVAAKMDEILVPRPAATSVATKGREAQPS